MTDEQLEVSKTLIKKEMLALRGLGQQLIDLPEAQLKKIPLEEKLADAIETARKITKHGGRKRQLQYVGKLMRYLDPEPIRAALEHIESGNKQDNQLFHLKEQWRDRLLIEGAESLTDFINQYPSTDQQRLRQLIRNYKNAKTDDKKANTARLIYKLISQQIG